jgi:hypothetical protein
MAKFKSAEAGAPQLRRTFAMGENAGRCYNSDPPGIRLLGTVVFDSRTDEADAVIYLFLKEDSIDESFCADPIALSLIARAQEQADDNGTNARDLVPKSFGDAGVTRLPVVTDSQTGHGRPAVKKLHLERCFRELVQTLLDIVCNSTDPLHFEVHRWWLASRRVGPHAVGLSSGDHDAGNNAARRTHEERHTFRFETLPKVLLRPASCLPLKVPLPKRYSVRND